MTTRAVNFQRTPRSTVGEVLSHHPKALQLFQDYQSGTRGICVITRDDTLAELCQRFGKSVQKTMEKLERMEGKDESGRIF